MLLNASKDIGLAVKTGKTKYMEIGRNRDMIANEHIIIGSDSSAGVKTFKTFRLFSDKSELYSEGNKM